MAYNCVKFSGKECDGCGCCHPDDEYYCPVCGEWVEDVVYVDNNNEVIGCENCVTERKPREMLRND